MSAIEHKVLSFEESKSLAKTFAMSALVPDALRGKEADVLFIVLTGSEMGLGPMTSMRTFEVIKGKVGMKSEAMIAHVRSHPSVEYIRCIETSPQRAIWVSKLRTDSVENRTVFTWQDAVTAGLAGQDMYKKWPARMLQWRCASAHCKTHHSDIILGLYSTEEIESFARDVTPPSKVPSTGTVPKTEAETIAALTASIDSVKTTEIARAASASKPRMLQVPEDPTPEYGPDVAPRSERAKLEVAVEEAQTEGELTELVERITRLPAADKTSIRQRWGVRRDELRSRPIGVDAPRSEGGPEATP